MAVTTTSGFGTFGNRNSYGIKPGPARFRLVAIFSKTVSPAHKLEINATITDARSTDRNGVVLPVDGGLSASNGQPNLLSLLDKSAFMALEGYR
jgi:hypothetical protein